MGTFEERVVIAVQPEVAFDYRLDFASNLASYNSNVRTIEQVDGSGPGLGAKYQLRFRLGPGVSARASVTVTDVEWPRRVSDRTESRAGNVEEVVTFAPIGADGRSATEVRFVVTTLPQSRLARLTDPMAMSVGRRQVRAELRLMRQHLEAPGAEAS